MLTFGKNQNVVPSFKIVVSDFTDKNTIVYGHNMKDGSMFRTLNEYSDVEFTKLILLFICTYQTKKQ